MEKLILFITIIAWIMGCLSFLKVVATAYGALTYEGSTLQLQDRLRGLRRTYPLGGPFFVFIICLAWIIVF